MNLGRRSIAARTNADLAKDLGFDRHWTAALEALESRYSAGDVVLAPNEFLHFFDDVYPIHLRKRMIPEESVDWFLLHKGMRDVVDPLHIEEALCLHPHFANEVFVLYGRRAGEPPAGQDPHLQPVLGWVKEIDVPEEPDGHAALVKTVDRPAFLERCLDSLAGQFERVLVVDDGSQAANRARNEAAVGRVGAEYAHLGRNRGHACTLNTGIAMLLADLDIGWISAFDDDTELVAGGIERLRKVIDGLGPAGHANFYSGYASPHHQVHEETEMSGETVLICRSCSGQHMHAHRSYWEAVLPIPTAYDRAPKKTGGVFAGQGGEVDWWCSNWAPRSAIKRGGSVCVVPGLVTTFGQKQSTWGGPGV